jgi:hypothetical protein
MQRCGLFSAALHTKAHDLLSHQADNATAIETCLRGLVISS